MSLPNISIKSESALKSKKPGTLNLNPIFFKKTEQSSLPSISIPSEKSVVQENSEDDKRTDDFTCAICSEIFIKSTTLNCSHTFCKYCIDRWKTNQIDCPICRTRITEQVPTLVLDNIAEKYVESCSKEMQEHRKQVIEERTKEMNANVLNNEKTKGEESYTWNSLINALSFAEENNDWRDDEELLNGDWLNGGSGNSSDDDYDVYDYDIYY